MPSSGMPGGVDPLALGKHSGEVRREKAKRRGALKHGGRADLLRHSERAEEIAAQLRLQAPALADADEPTIVVLASLLSRIEMMNHYVDTHGVFDKRGAVRPVARLLSSAEANAFRAAASLGMTPKGRKALGIETKRGSALGDYLQERYSSD
jgi:hypothetical protein